MILMRLNFTVVDERVFFSNHRNDSGAHQRKEAGPVIQMKG